MKIKANPPLLYSVLNPETSSDSPSAKSKGVRFVSARQDANHIRDKGKVNHINQILFWYRLKRSRSNPPTKKIKDNKIKASLTSYEMVWATAHSLPSIEYLQLEDQPALIVE